MATDICVYPVLRSMIALIIVDSVMHYVLELILLLRRALAA
jgi:hypothetical protein